MRQGSRRVCLRVALSLAGFGILVVAHAQTIYIPGEGPRLTASAALEHARGALKEARFYVGPDVEIERSSLSITPDGIQFTVRGKPGSSAQARSVRMEDIDPATIKVSRTSLEGTGPSVEHRVSVLGHPGWDIYWKNGEEDARRFADALFALVQAAHGGGDDEEFQAIAAQYRAAERKPAFPEEARRFRVQAELAVEQKRFDDAVRFYREALIVAPWWPEGRFNLAMLLAESKRYPKAVAEMKRFLALEPQHPQARAAQDQIYRWESVVSPQK